MYVRGGTSRGLFFRAADLPPREQWERVFSDVMGSPDPNGRQLDGMGGGISSLSKVVVVEPSSDPDFDLAYTFAQVDVGSTFVDFSGNCGNLSSGVAPFALEAGILKVADGKHEFRLFNTNTGKTVLARVTVVDGRAAIDGDFALPGVAESTSPIELVYPSPAGSRTGALLPTGTAREVIDGIDVTLIDACLPMVLVRAADLGLSGTELPTDIDARTAVMARLETLRREGARRMGLCDDVAGAPSAGPKIGMVAAPADAPVLDGTTLAAGDTDLLVRVISMEQAHKAVPGTGAMCIAAAATLPDSLVTEVIGHTISGTPVRLGTPSGAVASAAVANGDELQECSLLRSARVLMRGQVACRVL